MTRYFLKNNISHFVGTLFLILITTGCGSDSELPGAQDPTDSDPLFSGTPMFYIAKPVPTTTESLADPLTFVGNARLVKKERAESGAREVNISGRQFSGNYDVRDLDVSFDGLFVLFAMRAPQLMNTAEEDQPSWNLWEYSIENDSLSRVISDDIIAEQGHDITPRYVTKERDILFASTRQKKSRAILTDEGKPAFSALEEDRSQPALNLHLLQRVDGSITQVTFNMSHDFYPYIQDNGRIVYSRWDNFGRDNINLYQMNLDGTENELLYGQHSHDTGTNGSNLQFIKPAVLATGEIYAMARAMDSTRYGGDFIRIDTDNYIDNTQATATTNGSGPAQISITDTSVQTDRETSTGGFYASLTPYLDNSGRALISWSPCRLNISGSIVPCTSTNLSNPNATPATQGYGIWVVNLNQGTRTPIITTNTGTVYTDVVIAAPRTEPTSYDVGDSLTGADEGKISSLTQSELEDPTVEEAILHIRNVYDFDGSTFSQYPDWANPNLTDADDRPARFVRIIKGVPEPSDTVKTVADGSFGRAGIQRMKQIIGYAPVEPDGSVRVRLPANVPLMVSVTDKDGKRIYDRHQNWLWFRPGEVVECKGCHTRDSEQPHGRYSAQATTTNTGQPAGSPYNGADPSILSPYAFATMAEAKTLLDTTALVLNKNLEYTDTWTDTSGETADPDWNLRYEDMPLYTVWDAAIPSGLPFNNNCETWNGRCRIIINYEQHIQPLWELDRNYSGAALASQHDNGLTTCTRCHNRVDELNQAQVPDGQLELTGELDGLNGVQIRSYVELFFDDVEQELDAGSVVDCTMDVPRVDGNGDPVLDGIGNPIIDTVTCDPTITPVMSASGAQASSDFFDLFRPITGSHRDYMTAAELRLIAEWLDIGGQYYNDHFDAPDN